jgi:glycosyltransferase involved in cell wall biosynthesis
MKISVITVVKDGEKFIEETIKSVLNQTHKDLEFILIDGVSSDSTSKIISKYNSFIHISICEKDKSQTDALIKGLDMASGDILCWLNYDDLFYSKETLSYVDKTFTENNDIDFLYGNDVLIDEFGKVIKKRSMKWISLRDLLYGQSISQPSSFFKREVYKQIGLQVTLDYSMDLCFFINIFLKFKVFHVNNFLSRNRIHDSRKMIKGRKQADRESRNLRINLGANKNFYRFFKLIHSVKRKIINTSTFYCYCL